MADGEIVTDEERRERLRRHYLLHPWDAHVGLFPHRHEYPFADFHRDLVADFWSDDRYFVDLGFRECGKTTLVEEGLVIAACQGRFRNCLIVGAKESLAAELLQNIKSEVENNGELRFIYGDMIGSPWTSTRIVTRHGYCIQAVGRDQSLRGTRHMNWRPDWVIINDFEDDEEVLTPEGRRRSLRWVLRVLRPATDRHRRRFRIYDTIRDVESVPMMLIKREKWPHRLIPIMYKDAAGDDRPTWEGAPEAGSMAWLEAERAAYRAHGEEDIWEREYMMNASPQADRVFTADMIKVEPTPRAWQAVYAMIDPARTVGRNAATTGWAVWSWVGHRLIVWESGARRLLPDEVVELAFRIYGEYAPVEVGIEENGLNEWLLQPIRARMSRDGSIPIRGIPAPRGKIDFIRGLQPFFAHSECVWAQDMPELREQLLGFPTGRIDAPNALAYALSLRPGRLIYENWNPNANIAVVEPEWNRSIYLAANASRAAVSLAMVQLLDNGRIAVLADWLAEGEPSEALEPLLREASMAAGRKLVLTAAAHPHFEDFGNVGLVQAARRLGCECRQAGSAAQGRDFIRQEISRFGAEGPRFLVAPAARWTLNAFAGGYSRPLRGGQLTDEPAANRYRLLMEGIEAMAGLLAWGLEDEEETPANWAYDGEGRRYRSALPERMRLHMRH